MKTVNELNIQQHERSIDTEAGKARAIVFSRRIGNMLVEYVMCEEEFRMRRQSCNDYVAEISARLDHEFVEKFSLDKIVAETWRIAQESMGEGNRPCL